MTRRGFTLIEVLVALVVAVAAMALLSQGFTTGARASTTAQFATRAALLAQRVVTDFETGVLPWFGLPRSLPGRGAGPAVTRLA